ncbi:MAG: SDR family NAD(P)-dependent oxidoreductase [Solirubrobacteraceae bacterium]
MISSLLDTILGRAVVGGYASVGYRISRIWHACDLLRLEGKVVVVSGATSGIGLAAAERFARLGAEPSALVRSDERGAQARRAIIERTQDSDVRISVVDLSSLESVRGCATRPCRGAARPRAGQQRRRHDAGTCALGRRGRAHGRDERGPLDASGPVGHSRCAIVGVSLLQGDPAAAQNREGADTIAWRALRPNRAMRSSRVWHDRRPRPKDLLPCTRETPQERERLWAESERLTGWQDPRTLVAARSNR